MEPFYPPSRAASGGSREARRARSTTLRPNLCGLPMTAHRIGSSRNALAIEIWLSYGSTDARLQSQTAQRSSQRRSNLRCAAIRSPVVRRAGRDHGRKMFLPRSLSCFPNFAFCARWCVPALCQPIKHSPLSILKRAAFFTPGRDGARANRVFLRKFTVCLNYF